jgi:hypothetical protein
MISIDDGIQIHWREQAESQNGRRRARIDKLTTQPSMQTDALGNSCWIGCKKYVRLALPGMELSEERGSQSHPGPISQLTVIDARQIRLGRGFTEKLVARSNILKDLTNQVRLSLIGNEWLELRERVLNLPVRGNDPRARLWFRSISPSFQSLMCSQIT